MKLVKNIFTVSFFAIMVVAGARAEIVSTTLLEQKLPTVNNATLTIQQNGTAVGTFTANSSTNETVNITVPTGSLASKDTISDADVATGAISQDKIKDLSTDLGKKEDTVNKVTDTKNYTGDADSTDKYPSMAVANQMAKSAAAKSAAGKLSNTFENKKNQVMVTNATGAVTPTTVDTAGEGNAVTAVTVADGKYTVTKGTTFATKAELNALDGTTTGSGAVVTNVTQTDGKVAVTKGNVQVPVGSATATTYASIWIE